VNERPRLDAAVLAALRAVAGEAHVIDDPELAASYETDWTRRFSGRASVVVRPGSTAEVAAVLSVCHDAGIPVVPQGGNTGLVGASVPRRGEVVLGLTRLDGLGDIDTVSAQVTAGAGVTIARLQDHATAAGLLYPVDLASRESATVGGTIATNAGGIRVLRYGPTRARLVGIEAVLADGSIVSRMGGLTKDNSGYELAQLFAGSEGTLAIVTAARLQLVRATPHRATALLGVADTEAALAILQRIRHSVTDLDAIEAFYHDGVEMVCRHTSATPPFATPPGCYLLVECAGREDPSERLVNALAECPEVIESAFATDRAQQQQLWRYREAHTESINAEGIPHKLDVTLPLTTLAEFEATVRERVAAAVPGARPILFGHLGDGNLHVNILGPAPDDDRATDVVLRLVASLGGSISAEHGIGIAKAPWLHLTRSEADIAAMRAIKRALDPGGILNPGVIFGHDA
jgi:FAD/FMN-containing dehydrogenase